MPGPRLLKWSASTLGMRFGSTALMFVAPLLLVAASAPLKFSGWIVFYDGGASVKSFRAHVQLLDTVSVQWLTCRPDGQLQETPAPDGPTPEQAKELVRIARANHVRVLATVANSSGGDFGPVGVERAISNEASMQDHARAMVKFASNKRLDGIDLDYESLKSGDRESFSRFVEILADACHKRKMILALALHAKVSEPGTWDGPQAQDWTRLGRAADLVRIMTYDEHWDSSPPGPIASPAWVNQVAEFAASKIPPRKLDLGLAAYGYDWVGSKAQDVDWDELMALQKTQGNPLRDAGSGELTLAYRDHKVFFEDAFAARAKFAIARSLRLRGIAMWRIGSEDPKVWEVAKANRGKD